MTEKMRLVAALSRMFPTASRNDLLKATMRSLRQAVKFQDLGYIRIPLEWCQLPDCGHFRELGFLVCQRHIKGN